jgi:HupH hydrogenase expression protein, C-terminal conserved region
MNGEGPRSTLGVVDDPSRVIDAVLRETARLLGALAADADCVGAIDLRSLPLGAADSARLREQLGAGEVAVTVGPDATTQITETGYAGVWWMRLCGADQRVLLEQIVVARVPPLVPAHLADIAESALRMERQLCAQPSAARGSMEPRDG